MVGGLVGVKANRTMCSVLHVGGGREGGESGREENHKPKQDPSSTHVNHSAKPAAPP